MGKDNYHLVALNKDWDEHTNNIIITTITPGTPATAQAPLTLAATRTKKNRSQDSQKAFSRFVYEIEKWDKQSQSSATIGHH